MTELKVNISTLSGYSLESVQQTCTHMLSSQTTYTQARANLASLLDQVIDHKELIVIKRRGNRNVALISAEELSSLLETAYLLRSHRFSPSTLSL